jgi:hypothetical protein
MAIKKYIGSVVNVANSFSQATRPKHVGQMSDLIQEYRSTTDNPNVNGWENFYISNGGDQKIDDAAKKTYAMIETIRENLQDVTLEDVRGWMKDLIVNKTYDGLMIQEKILKSLAKDSWRLSTREEEARGIDGYIDGEPVQIKPESYSSNPQANLQNINCRIIFYKKTKSKKGFKIV